MSIISRSVLNNVFRHQNVYQFSGCIKLYSCVSQPKFCSKSAILKTDPNVAKYSLNTLRYKSKKAYDPDEKKDDFEDEDQSLSKDSKLVKFNTTSMRTDIILKSALGIARNKVEQIFYDSKIRLNGKKILKKSASVRPGDEIDVIKSVSNVNPDHINVSRVIIMNAVPAEENISVTARCFKNLLIENYEQDPYKKTSID